MTQSFDDYCKKNQHSGNCTRLEAFSMGQKSRQDEIDELQKRIDKSIFILSTIDTHEEAYKAIDMLMRELKGATNEQ